MIDTRKAASMTNHPNPMNPNTPAARNHASPHVTHVTQLTHVTPSPFVLCLFLILTLCLPALASLSPERLRCEYLDNPLGIDTPQPRLSWVVESKQRA